MIKKILVIGRDPFKALMAAEGVNIALTAQKVPAIALSTAACNLKEAVVAIATTNPDLVVLSQCMGEDGEKILTNNIGRLNVIMGPSISINEVVDLVSH